MWNALKTALTPSNTPSPSNPTISSPIPSTQNPPLRLSAAQNKPIKTTYTSAYVPIPVPFLQTPPPEDEDGKPRPEIIYRKIYFATSALPEYKALYAAVLDNVLSRKECGELLRLAEKSVPVGEGGEGGERERDVWSPALVNMGGGYEILEPEYRNSDRIVWDCQEVVDRIWERCLQVQEVREMFAEISGHHKDVEGYARHGSWKFVRVNDRMRFLRYGKGGYFRPHCDGAYTDTRDPSRFIKTLFTVHLYLNDCKDEAGPGSDADLVGGATTFFSADEKRRMDIKPKAGRVLIFQHRRLYHSGDDVLEGTKYTMRTDIMYEFIKHESAEELVEGTVDGAAST